MDVMTETEALAAANDWAIEYGLCETQRSRFLVSIRFFFFESQLLTMPAEKYEALKNTYKKKRKQRTKLKVVR